MGAAFKASWPLLTAILGSSAIGGLTQPGAQELESFSGDPSVDPRRLLMEALDKAREASGVIGGELHRPLSIETRVPSLPSFVGGGLPFAIGASAQDQAFVNPKVAKHSLAGDEDVREPRGPRGPIENLPGDPPVSGPYGRVQRRPLDADDTLGDEGDDVSKALGAASMLMQLSKPRAGVRA